MWARDVNRKFLRRGSQAAHHFAGPQRFAEQSHPTVVRFADRTERIALVSVAVTIHAVARKIVGKFRVVLLAAFSRAEAKGFRRETFANLREFLSRRLRNRQAARAGVVESYVAVGTKLTHAIQMTEKIHNVRFVIGQQRKRRCPKF